MVLINNKEVGSLGYGLMGLSLTPTPKPDDEVFPILKSAIETGCVFWNTGAFYGRPDPLANLKLLNRYFTQYPEDRSKVVISVKGCLTLLPTMILDASRESCRASIKESLATLGTYIDVFESARVDPKVPIEETVKAIQEFVESGEVRSIALSECSASSIRRAAKVAKIAAVEVEYSLWSLEIEENNVLATCAELNIPIVSYSPLSRGFLSGQLKSKSDMKDDDIRHWMPRFSEENFPKNVRLVERLKAIAARKNVSASQLALAWVIAQCQVSKAQILPIPGTTSCDRLHENAMAKEVTLSNNELKEIRALLDSVEVHGGRYPDTHAGLLFGDSPAAA